MVESEQVRTWAARLAAPVAFFTAVTVLVVLIQRGLAGGEAEPTTNPPTLTATGSGTNTAPTTTQRRRRLYRVRAGDTLESIAARFDTTVDELVQLNPGIDPLALRTGQRIRVS